MKVRPDCEAFELKQFPEQRGECQTDGHFLCKNCKHIAPAEEMEYSDNVERFYPELLNFQQPQESETEPTFTCQGCKHELPMNFSMRTPDYCYMCDPNITVDELLQQPFPAVESEHPDGEDDREAEYDPDELYYNQNADGYIRDGGE